MQSAASPLGLCERVTDTPGLYVQSGLQSRASIAGDRPIELEVLAVKGLLSSWMSFTKHLAMNVCGCVVSSMWTWYLKYTYTQTHTHIKWTDCEQICSRISNNWCRTFRPRRPLSTVYKTVLYTVDKGLRGRNVLHQLLLIRLRICSESVRPMSTTYVAMSFYNVAHTHRHTPIPMRSEMCVWGSQQSHCG